MLNLKPLNRPTCLVVAERLDFILNQILVFLGQSLDFNQFLDEWFIQHGYVGQTNPDIDNIISTMIFEKLEYIFITHYPLIIQACCTSNSLTKSQMAQTRSSSSTSTRFT